ncbi:vegetative cell wall protein gp1-like [Iris pallida]|uniref:Vegetative cell wall protein gp1-like n=1 Tax=Iris pallida TaxID=29817 RepID=A0AAX6IA94_IRIPA|nr:vegetative cell wall protein gp1-like [Iris pallida]
MGRRAGGGSAGTEGKTGSAPCRLRTAPLAGRRQRAEVTRSWVRLWCVADLVQAVGRDLEAGHSRCEAGLARSPSWRRSLSVSSRRGRDKVSGWGLVVMVGMFLSACRHGHNIWIVIME